MTIKDIKSVNYYLGYVEGILDCAKIDANIREAVNDALEAIASFIEKYEVNDERTY